MNQKSLARGTTVPDTGLRILGLPIFWGRVLESYYSVLECKDAHGSSR